MLKLLYWLELISFGALKQEIREIRCPALREMLVFTNVDWRVDWLIFFFGVEYFPFTTSAITAPFFSISD